MSIRDFEMSIDDKLTEGKELLDEGIDQAKGVIDDAAEAIDDVKDKAEDMIDEAIVAKDEFVADVHDFVDTNVSPVADEVAGFMKKNGKKICIGFIVTGVVISAIALIYPLL